jgi:hypothetical protein
MPEMREREEHYSAFSFRRPIQPQIILGLLLIYHFRRRMLRRRWLRVPLIAD